MHIVLIGAPGSGKGTQAKRLADYFNIPHISTGDALRQAVEQGDPLGQEIHERISKGNFVSDEIIFQFVRTLIDSPRCARGYILDGFPRTLAQAQGMASFGIKVGEVVEISVDPSLIMERITGRLVHQASGRSYHLTFNPPKVAGIDDITGDALTQRDDDRPEFVEKRLSHYERQTAPVAEFFKQQADQGLVNYLTVDGSQTSDQVFKTILYGTDR